MMNTFNPVTGRFSEPIIVGAIKLTRDVNGLCIVSIEHAGRFVEIMRDSGDLISHIVEPLHIEELIGRSLEKNG